MVSPGQRIRQITDRVLAEAGVKPRVLPHQPKLRRAAAPPDERGHGLHAAAQLVSVGLLGGEGYQPAYYMIPPKYPRVVGAERRPPARGVSILARGGGVSGELQSALFFEDDLDPFRCSSGPRAVKLNKNQYFKKKSGIFARRFQRATLWWGDGKAPYPKKMLRYLFLKCLVLTAFFFAALRGRGDYKFLLYASSICLYAVHRV